MVLKSVFIKWSDDLLSASWKMKLETVASALGQLTDWILAESGDILYLVGDTALSVDQTSAFTLSVGPDVDSQLIAIDRLWSMVGWKLSIQNASVRRVKRNGALQVPLSNSQWVQMNVVGCQGPFKAAISVSPCNTHVMDSNSLCDVFLSHCEGSVEKFNQHINAQRHHSLRVRCAHYTKGKAERFYSIVGLVSVNAIDHTIVVNEKEHTIAEYFSQFHNIQLTRPDLPLAVDTKGRYFPLELCSLAVPFRLGETRSSHPVDLKLLTNHPVLMNLKNFGIAISSPNPISTRGRQLPPATNRGILPLQRDINACVFSFVPEDVHDSLLSMFVKQSESRLKAKFMIDAVMSLGAEEWEADLKKGLTSIKNPPAIILIIMGERVHDSVYERLKCVLDLRLRVPSQCITVERFIQLKDTDSYWESLLNHIVLKVGPSLPKLRPSGTVIGGIQTARVHKLPCKLISVSMSIDNQLSVFATRVMAEAKGQDFDYAEIFYQILLDYFAKCAMFPNRLIMYVDQPETGILFSCVSGLIRGTHAAVSRINRELKTGINPKLGSGSEVNPNWTFLTFDKDSSTTIDTESKQAVVVDTGLVADHEIQFMFQDNGIRRPARYTVIHDANSFTVPELENFTQQVRAWNGSAPMPLIHTEKALNRALLYLRGSTELSSLSDASQLKNMMNQVYFDSESTQFRDRAFYI